MRWRHCGVKLKNCHRLSMNRWTNSRRRLMKSSMVIGSWQRLIMFSLMIFRAWSRMLTKRWLTLTPRLSRLMWTPQKRLTAKLKLRLIRCTRLWKRKCRLESASMLLRQTCANLLITPCVKIASCRQSWIIWIRATRWITMKSKLPRI